MDYPTAIASKDRESVADAINWCIEHTEFGDTITVWMHLKSNLSKEPMLEHLVKQQKNVVHITGRGGGRSARTGPVLMAWPDMQDIRELVRYSRGVRELCVISWNQENLRPWVSAANPVILGDGSAWED